MKDTFIPSTKTWKKWVILDAKDQTLGRLASQISKILIGKLKTNYTPFLDTGDNVIVINADKITVSGNKELQKLYYRNSQRPGSLKIETFKQLKQRIPSRIIEKAVWGMLPKGVLGREYYRRLFVYSDNKINYKKTKEGEKQSISLDMANSNNWIKVDL